MWSRIVHLSYTSDSLPDFLELKLSILQNRGDIIYKGSLQDLEIFLDIVQRSRDYFDVSDSIVKTQLAIFPALASQQLSMLNLLSGTCAVSVSTTTISDWDLYLMNHEYLKSPLTIVSAFGWPLNLAIGLVLDLEVVEYLCHNGARLGRSSIDNGFDEPYILRKLRLTTTVSDARKQSCYVK